MSADLPRAVLRYISAGRRVERPLEWDVARLGRSPELEVVFSESESGVSRHHATILREKEGWFIEDAGSRNGTYVNGEKVSRNRLGDGDRIDLGPFLLRFHFVDEKSGSNRVTVPGQVLAGEPEAVASPYASGAASASISLRMVEDSVDRRTIAGSLSHLERSGTASGSLNRDQAWAIKVFKEVSEALLKADDLDAILDTVMNLAFEHVSAERGVICIDTGDGKLVPRAVRSDRPGESQVQFSQSIVNEAVASQTAVLVKNAVDDDRFNEAVSIVQRSVRSAICVPLYHDGRTAGVLYVDTANRSDPFSESQLELLVGLGLFSAISIAQFEFRESARQELEYREKLARYHTPAVVDMILGSGNSDMQAKEANVSVLFADIKGFTEMSEHMEPNDVVGVLNLVFERLVDAVFRHDGTLDKFMGDGMLAYFGAPLALENHALAAVEAAIEMQDAVTDLNASGALPSKIAIRIGINSGPVVMGDVGSPRNRNLTIIGDTVNVASRYESSVAQPGEIVIGPPTHALIGDHVSCDQLEPVKLKGIQDMVRPYRLNGLISEPAK